MSAATGYLYAMINPSLPGLCKIGVTTKHPLERTKELSAATGVPTPFVLAHYRHVAFPFQAEAEIHRNLEYCRINESREFFMISLAEAIGIIDRYQESETEDPEVRQIQCDMVSAEETPMALLFSTFPDDGTPRELTEMEQAQCRAIGY